MGLIIFYIIFFVIKMGENKYFLFENEITKLTNEYVFEENILELFKNFHLNNKKILIEKDLVYSKEVNIGEFLKYLDEINDKNKKKQSKELENLKNFFHNKNEGSTDINKKNMNISDLDSLKFSLNLYNYQLRLYLISNIEENVSDKIKNLNESINNIIDKLDIDIDNEKSSISELCTFISEFKKEISFENNVSDFIDNIIENMKSAINEFYINIKIIEEIKKEKLKKFKLIEIGLVADKKFINVTENEYRNEVLKQAEYKSTFNNNKNINREILDIYNNNNKSQTLKNEISEQIINIAKKYNDNFLEEIRKKIKKIESTIK